MPFPTMLASGFCDEFPFGLQVIAQFVHRYAKSGKAKWVEGNRCVEGQEAQFLIGQFRLYLFESRLEKLKDRAIVEDKSHE